MWQSLFSLCLAMFFAWLAQGEGALFDLTFGTLLDPPKHCARPELANPWEKPECFYSGSYHHARERFHEEAQAAGADALERRYLDADSKISVDFAMFNGSKEKMVIHLSGTHGTEGFAGSAIQSAVLATWKNITRSSSSKPTVLFIHAVNPYGFANWRRFNENNVDLNRNALFTKQEFQEVLGRDNNIAGYEDFNHLFNPEGPVLPAFIGFLKNTFDAASAMIQHGGLAAFKKAMVTGTYKNPKGIFYGGNTLQQSHRLIQEYLQSTGLLDSVKKLAVIDVHTGLGPLGRDTMLLIPQVNNEYAHKVLSPESHANSDSNAQYPVYSIEGLGKESKGASAGYELLRGPVRAGLGLLFKNLKANDKNHIIATQEFGTYPAFYVGMAMIRENQAFHYDPDPVKREKEALRIREVFNPSRHKFQERTIKRGMIAFQQVYHGIANAS